MKEDFKGKKFDTLDTGDIAKLLMSALDDGEWHTPSVSDVKIHTQHAQCIYGYCNLSKHNTYHDAEHWFNINGNNIAIWKEEYVKGKANKSLQRKIYNFKLLGDILEELTTVVVNPPHQ